MNFLKLEYLPGLFILFVIILHFFIKYEDQYFSIMKKYWGFSKSKKSKLASFLYFSSLCLLFTSLLDLRGREENVETNISDQKTIILLDMSSSMLTEDVRPNRYERGLFVARHFVKKSFGHQVSIISFSDTTKRVIPFTDDIDLLDARLSALSEININSGGTKLGQAILEAIQYLKLDNGSNTQINGNILIITDAEGHDINTIKDIPENINVALVALGSESGGRIPLRSAQGRFLGYKKDNGVEVISKINKEAIKSLENKIPSFNYWLLSSYNIPTDAILSFFKGKFEDFLKKGNVKIRPVKAEFLLIPFVVLFILFTFFRRAQSFLYICLVLVSINSTESLANEEGEEAEAEKTALESELENKLSIGADINDNKKLLAAEYLKNRRYKKANILLKEDKRLLNNQNDLNSQINLGTSYLFSGNIKKGVEILERVKNNLDLNDDRYPKINENIILALRDSKKSKNKKGKGSGKGKNKDKDKDKKSSKGNKKDKKKDKEQGKQDFKKMLNEREEDIRRKKKAVKIPAILKQILDEDKNIQKKYLKPKGRSKAKGEKDW